MLSKRLRPQKPFTLLRVKSRCCTLFFSTWRLHRNYHLKTLDFFRGDPTFSQSLIVSFPKKNNQIRNRSFFLSFVKENIITVLTGTGTSFSFKSITKKVIYLIRSLNSFSLSTLIMLMFPSNWKFVFLLFRFIKYVWWFLGQNSLVICEFNNATREKRHNFFSEIHAPMW